MKWVKDLLLSESVVRHKSKYRWKINNGFKTKGVYVITLPLGDKNQLEFFDSKQLSNKYYPKDDLVVVGMCMGEYEAIELINDFTQRVWNETGEVNLRDYVMEHLAG